MGACRADRLRLNLGRFMESGMFLELGQFDLYPTRRFDQHSLNFSSAGTGIRVASCFRAKRLFLAYIVR